ncbi:MAG: glycosyltransferase [Pseudomonadota bacterium]
MKVVVIAFLDKAWPPNHSFVDGMLASEAASQPDIIMRLCISRIRSINKRPCSYKHALCLPVLFPRRGFKRLINFFVAMHLILYQSSRERKRGRKIVLLIRNEPIYLFAASVLRSRVDRVVFQSSFPHEEYSGNFIMRWVARKLYRLARKGVDVVTGVSPEGVSRVHRLFPHADIGPYIPLLSDMPVNRHKKHMCGYKKKFIDFIYLGAHNKSRELEVVLTAIVRAVSFGVQANFYFIGASVNDERRLSLVSGVQDLVKKDVIHFKRPVPRSELTSIMEGADVGISLIPPKAIYYEASPTKLAEYMGAGLAVIASRGIPMQERFVKESDGGVLVDWDVESIADAIYELSKDRNRVDIYAARSQNYAEKLLRYEVYLPQFRKILGLD